MPGNQDSPGDLASWLEEAWRQLAPARVDGPGYRREAVDDFVAGILARVRTDRLDPYRIRTAQFPVRPWGARYDPRGVLKLRDELADRVERSPLVSTEAAAGRGDVTPAALAMTRQIKAAKFRIRRRGGYDQREVDDYLAVLERAVRGDQSLNGAQIRARQFSPAKRFAPGYAEEDVRQFLERVAGYADNGGR